MWLIALAGGVCVGVMLGAMLAGASKVDGLERAYWRGFAHGVMQHDHDEIPNG